MLQIEKSWPEKVCFPLLLWSWITMVAKLWDESSKTPVGKWPITIGKTRNREGLWRRFVKCLVFSSPRHTLATMRLKPETFQQLHSGRSIYSNMSVCTVFGGRWTDEGCLEALCEVISATIEVLPWWNILCEYELWPESAATGRRSNGGTQCDMTPVMRCRTLRCTAGFIVCRQW